MPERDIEIVEGPDSLGRFTYIERWEDVDRATCAVCGWAEWRGCTHWGSPESRREGQVFFATLWEIDAV